MADESEWDTDAKVEELKAATVAAVERVKWGGHHHGTKAFFQRWLRARRGDVDGAAKMLERHLQWREEECPWFPSLPPLEPLVRPWIPPLDPAESVGIQCPHEEEADSDPSISWQRRDRACPPARRHASSLHHPYRLLNPGCPPSRTQEPAIRTRKAVFCGRARDGSTVVLIRPAFHVCSETDVETTRQMVVFVLEHALCDAHAHGSECFTILFDFTDFGYSNFDTDATSFILKMLSVNYPERLANRACVRQEGRAREQPRRGRRNFASNVRDDEKAARCSQPARALIRFEPLIFSQWLLHCAQI